MGLALMLPLAGCVAESMMLYKHLSKPKVTFADATQWRCDEEVKVPNGSTIEQCSRCRNAARIPQTVTIDKEETFAVPGTGVVVCSTKAWIEGPAPSASSREPSAQSRR